MFLAWRQMLKVVDIPFTLIGALQIMWTYYHMNPKSMYIYYVSIQKHKCFKKIDKIDTKKKKNPSLDSTNPLATINLSFLSQPTFNGLCYFFFISYNMTLVFTNSLKLLHLLT